MTWTYVPKATEKKMKPSRKPDDTIKLLKEILKADKRQISIMLPERTFVELSGLGYIAGSSYAARLTTEGHKAIQEAKNEVKTRK